MGSTRFVAMALLVAGLAGCEGTVSEFTDSNTPPGMLGPFDRAPTIASFRCEPAASGAPMTELCQWHITEPEGQPVSCTLDIDGDENAEYSIADCLAAPSQKHTFAAPGSYTVKLTVSDAAGNRSSATLVFEVEQPNRPPVISAFSAAPSSGLTPLVTTWSWAISDPDGEALTCTLDVGADGSAEYTLPGCGSAMTQAHTVTAAGTTEVVLRVTDARGLSATRALTLSARNPVGDLRISRAEWGQTVIAANPKLIEGKPALLRLYVLADRANIAGVVVKAEGFRAGASLGTLALTGPAAPPITENPASLATQYRATVPAAWIAPGLEVRVTIDPEDALGETDETNNTLTVTPVLGKPTVLPVTAVPIVHQGVTAKTFELGGLMQQVWPLKGVSTQTRAPYTYSGLLSPYGTSAWSQLLGEIAGARAADGSKRYYYGFVRAGYGGGIAGIGYVANGAAVGRDDSPDTAAHELGHNMGRNHAPCGGVAGADPNYPYAGGKIGSYGFDVGSGQLIGPASAYDLMSYCNPTWVSDHNYRAVQSYLEARPPTFVAPLPPHAELLLVTGTITSTGVFLRPLQRVLASPAPEAEGPYRLRLRGGFGAIEVAFEAVEVADADERWHFTALVPYPGRVLEIEVALGGQVLRRLSAAAPAGPGRDAVSLVDSGEEVVLRWDAAAYPHAAVSHLGESERTTLALFLQGGAAVVRTEGLPPGGSFEVSLSDGLNPVRQVVHR